MVISIGMVEETVFSPTVERIPWSDVTLVRASREPLDERLGEKPREH